jgi:MurNAc alpha-1-phosphate uridylyltransferase|tara:strand:- start:105 stop:776 length:672 start_codon:yes stop_codon:yes gene_type:complete
MKVMILAAGYGKRMLPLTKTIPKPLLEVAGKTLIQRNIEALLNEGFEDFIINTSYLGSMIKNHVNQKFPSTKINFSEEDQPLGTGGGIVKALSLIGEDPFILINADISHDISIKPLNKNIISAHIIGVENPDHNINGDFSLDGDIVVIKEGKNDFTWTGISVVNPLIFNKYKDHDRFFNIWDPVMLACISDRSVTGEITKGKWIDTGTVGRLELANKMHKDEN